MSSVREKVVVAMSGGVDSSVAACLLVEQGYDVMGLFMRVGAHEPEQTSEPRLERPLRQDTSAKVDRHQGCCSAIDAADARYVAGMLGIPFYALNFQDEFDRIIDYFADEYARGRTPNPCVVCNDKLKFGKLVYYADAVGARFIATGHYARLGRPDGQPTLARAKDSRKDQTYVLFGLKRSILDRIMFPIGDLTKPQVREIAARFNLPNQNKPDSVDICFVPDRNYARVVRERRPDAFVSGDVVNADGEMIGRHDGVPNYTIGQRRGLGIAMGKPVYVTTLSTTTNTVTLGDDEELRAIGLVGSRANFLADVADTFRANVKIRYLHVAAPATVRRLPKACVEVYFDEPQRAITPGQAAVFYDGEVVLGGAWIERAIMRRADSPSAEQGFARVAST
jgi:tRNA-specific 2-thiouridylase